MTWLGVNSATLSSSLMNKKKKINQLPGRQLQWSTQSTDIQSRCDTKERDEKCKRRTGLEDHSPDASLSVARFLRFHCATQAIIRLCVIIAHVSQTRSRSSGKNRKLHSNKKTFHDTDFAQIRSRMTLLSSEKEKLSNLAPKKWGVLLFSRKQFYHGQLIILLFHK